MVDEKKFAEMLMSVEQYRKNAEASYYAMLMRYDKAFMRDEDCLHIGDGEYCVYMWLHADGVPFYVGMGKGNGHHDYYFALDTDINRYDINEIDFECKL
jgi:hypothetical protein